jgi:Tetratricopeptide repeat
VGAGPSGAADREPGSASGGTSVPRHDPAGLVPGTIPPVWNVPARNADFTGRGTTLELLRDMTRALELVTGIRAAHQASLGSDHPNTLVAVNNLACYLRCIGQLSEALGLAADTLGRMERKLGRGHPLTLSCAVNVANCHGDCGDIQAAEALERWTISLPRETLGRDHPDTLVCEANLAVTLRQVGMEQEAEELRGRIITDLGRVLGTGHPDSAQLHEWQRINQELEPQQI